MSNLSTIREMTRLDEPTVHAAKPISGLDADSGTVVDARRRSKRFCIAVTGVYLIAFVLPVFVDTGVLANHLGVRPKGFVYGWQAFLVGWVVQRFGGWFANVAIWAGIGLLAFKRPIGASIAGLTALALGLTYLGLLVDRSMIAPESYSVGYFCWLGSAVLLAASGPALTWIGGARQAVVFTTVALAVSLIGLVVVERMILAATAPPTDMALADRLRTGDVAARRTAVRKLARHHNPEFVPALIEAAHDPDDQIRQSAIGGLGEIGPAAVGAVPVLIEILRNPVLGQRPASVDARRAANSRSAAAAALGGIGPAAKEAVPVLAAALQDENIPVRRWAATSLGEMGSEGRSAVPSLLDALGDSDIQVRRDAIGSLKKIGPGREIIPKLAHALKDHDPTVREAALAVVKSLEQQK